MPKFTRVAGVVSAITADKITVTDKEGKSMTVALSPQWYVVTTQTVDIDAIKPGSFIASANMDQPNGEGEALEMRMFEPGQKLGEGNYPMDAPKKMMTNATVSSVSKGANGRELTVTYPARGEYPGGTKKIIVPPSGPGHRLDPGRQVDRQAGGDGDGACRPGRRRRARRDPDFGAGRQALAAAT